MIEYAVACPSWGRAGRVRVLEMFPAAVLYVAARQADDYRRAYPEAQIVEVPDEMDGIGTVALKRNWIMAQASTPYLVMIDDDVKGLGRYEQGEHARLGVEETAAFIRAGFALAAELGVALWGVNALQDKRAYSVMRPFKLLSPILGPFTGHLLPHGLRYDDTVGAKEDYDFWLQAIHRDHMTLRFDQYHYLKHEETRGGFASVRTLAWETQTCRAIERKWGTRTIRYEATKKNILEARVHVPIAGI